MTYIKTKSLVKKHGGKCKRCGGVYPAPVYDFHHRDPNEKEFAIGDGILSMPFEKVIEESKKCDLLCHNCHYIEQYRQGYEDIEDALEKLEKIRINRFNIRLQLLHHCQFPDCDRPVAGVDLCLAHYKQYLRKGRNIKLLKPVKTETKPCKFLGCNEPRHAKGYCSFHYQRLSNGIDLDAPIPLRGMISECLVEECNRKPVGNGLCSPHWQQYNRMRKYKELVEMVGDKCTHCQKSYPIFIYEFHHKDQNQKKFHISLKITSKNFDDVVKESLKCVLLCANCHRRIHFESFEFEEIAKKIKDWDSMNLQ
ncbi:MAG: hypothetical protein WA941_23465 [Nitrososphaeraceae archaeon]